MKNLTTESLMPRALATISLALACLASPVAALAAPDKAAGFYEDALKKFEKNDFPGAAIQLKNAIQQDSRMLAAHLLLGKVFAKSGDYKAAEAAFEEALKQGVSRGEVALPLGQIYLALGEPKLVIDRIPASGLPPGLQMQVLTMRGTAYYEMGNPAEAARSFDAAREADPRSPDPYIAEVPMLLGSGKADRARAAAAKAVELGPDNAAAWNMQASVKHAALDIKGALADYDRALTLEPRHTDARVARAAVLVDIDRDADALKDLDYLRGTTPTEPRASYLRAVLAGRKGDIAAMNATFKEVAGLLERFPPAWIARREQFLMVAAIANYSIGNRGKAQGYLETIVGRNGGNLAARKLLASLYIDQRDFARAGPQLEVLQKVLPNDARVLLMLGTVQLSQRRYAQATELLEKAAARGGAGEANRSLAFSQLGLGRDDLGQASLEKALAANPDDSVAGTTLAMLHARAGRPQKALQIAEQMVKRSPENLTALNFLGSVKGAVGDKAGARAAYEAVLAKLPTFRPAILNLARLDLGEGRVDPARDRLNAMLTTKADDVDALVELAGVEQRAGRPAEALRHLKKANESQRRDMRPGLSLIDLQLAQRLTEEANSTAKDLASKFPDSITVQLALGRTMLAMGDARSARGVFQAATRLADYDPDTQVRIGRLQLQAGNPDGALYNAQKAMQGRPDDVAALALVVEVEIRRRDAAKAEAALKVMTAKHPNNVATALAGANYAMARMQYPAAIAGYKTALSREESTANALELVRAHVAAGEGAKAVTFLEGWVKKHPADAVAQKALAEAQYRAGQLDAARRSYAKVVAAAPTDALLRNNYATLLQTGGDLAGAALEAEAAYKLSPQNPTIADTLGWILVQQGQLDAGLRYLREARLRSPENPEFRYHLAFALAKAGRNGEAKEELRAALATLGANAKLNPEVSQLKRDLGI